MSDRWAYIARTTEATAQHPAGCVVAAAVDDPLRRASNAKDIAKWMREGLAIERVPVEWVRKHLLTTTPYVPEGNAP